MSDTSYLQVLEFQLGSETYCVDIEYIAEIVDMDELTPIPNSPQHIEGVMDLRGRTTSIVNPKRVLDVEGAGDGRRIMVFDPDAVENGEAVGWIVDGVEEVIRIDPDAAEDPPGDDDAVRGIVQRDEDFLIWVDPESITA